MTTLEMILSILTALSGIGNLTQWANLRAMRNKATYEAEDVHIQVLNKTIVMQADEIKRLQERQKVLEEQIIDLQTKMLKYATLQELQP